MTTYNLHNSDWNKSPNECKCPCFPSCEYSKFTVCNGSPSVWMPLFCLCYEPDFDTPTIFYSYTQILSIGGSPNSGSRGHLKVISTQMDD